MSVSRAYAYGFAIPRPSVTHRHVWDASERFMLEDLARSGLVPEDIGAYPMWINLPRHADCAYVIPYRDQEGKYLADNTAGVTGKMHRIRCHYPDLLARNEIRDAPRYSQPSSRAIGSVQATLPYITPQWHHTQRWFLVEGEKKAAALAKRWGVGVVGIGGCANWHDPQDTEREGRLHPWLQAAFRKVRGVLTIVPDGDIHRLDISMHYRGLANACERLGIQVEIIAFADKIDDWLVANPQAELSVVDDWERIDIQAMVENRAEIVRVFNLQTQGQNNDIIANEYNILQLFNGHPSFEGAFRMDVDRLRLTGTRPDYREQVVVGDVTAQLQSVFHIRRVTRGMVKACIGNVAWQNKVYPIRNWLNGLKWDGRKRLEVWMQHCLGVADGLLVRELGPKCLIAAVARRFEPGCMVDYMTILKGEQGIGKSSAIRMLFGQDNTVEYTRGAAEGKDWVMAAHSGWCLSDEELGSMSYGERNKLKGQITIRSDTLRIPYASEISAMPRQFVWWGSTNDEEFLPDDPTGHRRYAVVEVSRVDFAKLAEWREQLWAQAVHRFKQGVEYSNVALASVAAEQYVMADPVVEQVGSAIQEWLSSKFGKAQTADFGGVQCFWLQLTQLFPSLGVSQMAPHKAREVASALRKLGWRKANQKYIGGRHYNSVFYIPCLSH